MTSGGSRSSGDGATGSTGAGTPGSDAAGSDAAGSTNPAPDGQGAPNGRGGGRIDSRVGVKGESEDNLGPFGMISSPPDPMDVTISVVLGLLALAATLGWRLRRRQSY